MTDSVRIPISYFNNKSVNLEGQRFIQCKRSLVNFLTDLFSLKYSLGMSAAVSKREVDPLAWVVGKNNANAAIEPAIRRKIRGFMHKGCLLTKLILGVSDIDKDNINKDCCVITKNAIKNSSLIVSQRIKITLTNLYLFDCSRATMNKIKTVRN